LDVEMNRRKASFAGGVLHSTDDFSSRDHDEGRLDRHHPQRPGG
jgi:hypothetical protein